MRVYKSGTDSSTEMTTMILGSDWSLPDCRLNEEFKCNSIMEWYYGSDKLWMRVGYGNKTGDYYVWIDEYPKRRLRRPESHLHLDKPATKAK